MKKVAILVEDGFVDRHVGVRNLIFSLYRELECIGCEVDFIYQKSIHGNKNWYRSFIRDEFIFNNYASINRLRSGSSSYISELWKKNKYTTITGVESADKVTTTALGSNIDIYNYDVYIYSVPWLEFQEINDIENGLHIGIVYDMIPNDYVLYNMNKPFNFATKHLSGYRFFNSKCKHIMCISQATANRYKDYFGHDDKVIVMPPSVPNYLRNNSSSSLDFNKHTNVSEKKIILAGPFDPRKGIEYFPKLLNSLTVEINSIYIYGKQRCSDTELEKFFSSLKHNNIRWYETISSHELSEIYKDSDLLIFPSDSEGLGLPVIEAQLLGCQVITSNFDSAKEILCSEDIQYINFDIEHDRKLVDDILCCNNSHDYIQNKAEDFFSKSKSENFYRSILELI
ncbi:glycosyltransferase [Vibrio ruber]|uniref:glycosyltransferase n=1 Tax=Vibrio ruber TaxID=184755 RepID=UPI0028930671|nr:glycosyltransferase [Vibrio ruber]WNJ96496.1 glycosyltransferase [Vibrio ruber]